MKRLISILMTGICAFGIASQALAISISLEPNSQAIGVGGNASVDVVVSGLGDFASPSLGAFLFDLSYDSSILSAPSVAFGTHLDLGILGSAPISFSTPVLINLAELHLEEVSFESASDLNANQPATFILATLGFTGLAPGTSPLAFIVGKGTPSLSDEIGASLEFDTTGGTIRVVGDRVPDSGVTLPLLAFGFLSLLALKRTEQRFPI